MIKMLKSALLITVLMVATASAEDLKCEDCTAEKPCEKTVDAGDGCNTCTISVYCRDREWYTMGMQTCTLMSCLKETRVDPPNKGNVLPKEE